MGQKEPRAEAAQPDRPRGRPAATFDSILCDRSPTRSELTSDGFGFPPSQVSDSWPPLGRRAAIDFRKALGSHATRQPTLLSTASGDVTRASILRVSSAASCTAESHGTNRDLDLNVRDSP